MPHIHDKIDFTVEVFIIHDNKVLLRMHDKYHIWLGVGGHNELDQDPNETAIREVKEEVGMDVRLVGEVHDFRDGSHELVLPRFMNRHRINETHEHVALIYFATSDSAQFVATQGEEKSEAIRWFSLEELDDPSFGIFPRIVYYAKTALMEVQRSV